MESSNYPSSMEDEENREKLGGGVVEREHMFDKVVTPSDVGKLNRLVIPKQHAEKYFPLDSSTNEKGLLLNFEDRTGKAWRFRYSYWNSSQSYVMTKGWSRFVKEKKLDAGDIVSFHRENNKFFIDWRRRRPDIGPPPLLQFSVHPPPFGGGWSSGSSRSRTAAPAAFLLRSYPQDYCDPHSTTHILGTNVWDHLTTSNLLPYHHPNWRSAAANYSHPQFGYATTIPTTATNTTTMFFRPSSSFPSVQQPHISASATDHRGAVQVHEEGSGAQAQTQTQVQAHEPMVFDSVPVVQGKGKAAGKRLRLFGVNMDCCPPNVHNDYDASSSSSSNIHQNPLTLQLDLSVIDKGKLSSSSSSPSSMSLDLDM